MQLFLFAAVTFNFQPIKIFPQRTNDANNDYDDNEDDCDISATLAIACLLECHGDALEFVVCRLRSYYSMFDVMMLFK